MNIPGNQRAAYEQFYLVLAAIFIAALVACNLIFQKFFCLGFLVLRREHSVPTVGRYSGVPGDVSRHRHPLGNLRKRARQSRRHQRPRREPVRARTGTGLVIRRRDIVEPGRQRDVSASLRAPVGGRHRVDGRVPRCAISGHSPVSLLEKADPRQALVASQQREHDHLSTRRHRARQWTSCCARNTGGNVGALPRHSS